MIAALAVGVAAFGGVLLPRLGNDGIPRSLTTAAVAPVADDARFCPRRPHTALDFTGPADR